MTGRLKFSAPFFEAELTETPLPPPEVEKKWTSWMRGKDRIGPLSAKVLPLLQLQVGDEGGKVVEWEVDVLQYPGQFGQSRRKFYFATTKREEGGGSKKKCCCRLHFGKKLVGGSSNVLEQGK